MRACAHPVDAWQLDDGRVIFSERGSIRRALKLRCGQCIGCRLDRSCQWASRCMHEAQMHEMNSFVTLTYADEFIPQRGSLIYADFQKFLKRLRKKMGKVRFYMCGEYGDLNSRPHFHACLFGVGFADREYLRTLPSGSRIYRSPLLEELWPFGYSSIGDVTFESAAYVARYVCKKITGPMAEAHYSRVDLTTGEIYEIEPEFCQMSLKPGIGFSWFQKFSTDAFPRDYVIIRGKKCKVPKYYKTLLKNSDAFLSDEIDFDRESRVKEFVDDCSLERLAVREVVAKARLNFKKRALEF